MNEKLISEEDKKKNNEIKEAVFKLEKENYKQKSLTSTQVVQKIKKIVEEKVKWLSRN